MSLRGVQVGYNVDAMRVFWMAGLLACLCPAIAQEVKLESQPCETVAETVATEPPYYSLNQLKQWIEQAKQRTKARIEQLEQSGVVLDPKHRHKLEEGPEYLEALWDYLYVRAYPNDFVDWGAYLRAAEHRDLMAGAFFPASGAQWEFVGPRNTTPPYRTYFGTASVAGRVNAVAYDPVNSNVYYAGAPQGGVWKTTDGGATWQPLTDHWQFLQVACIAVHPTNPNVIYVGTGDFQGWMRPFSQGVMRSTDGGQTWQSLGATQFGNLCVSDIIIDPENPNIITVCTGWGPYQSIAGSLWRSTDGGDTWSRVSTISAIWSDLAVSARNPTTGVRYYYAVGHGNPGRLLRSSNRGQTWTTLTPPFSAN
ncbi:MAG: WD40/YVTN/BNR-like repeat-containing protein [Fimbriimonadales bacterium]